MLFYPMRPEPRPGSSRMLILHQNNTHEPALSAESALMERDIPITLYSAKPGMHPMSVPTGTNPFGKDSGFSMPIQQYDRSVTKDL